MASRLFHRESEQCVLGGLFLAPVTYDEVAAVVSTADFADEGHRLIFEVMADQARAGKALDIVTIAERLERDNKLDQVGGFQYLGVLARDTPSAANVLNHAQTVRDYSQRRKLVKLADAIPQWIAQDADINTTIARLQGSIHRLDSETQQTGPVLVRDKLPEVIDLIDQKFNGVGDQGVPTGMIGLDRMICGLRGGRAYVVAGRPAMGKSIMGLQLAGEIAHAGRPVLLFTLEMGIDEQIERLIAAYGRIDLSVIQSGQLSDNDWPKLTSAVTQLSDAPIWIDETPGLSLHALLSRSRRMHRKAPLGAVVIDHLGLIEHKAESRQYALAEIARALKNLAKELGCPVIELVQLNRSVEQRPNKRPLMSDLRESGEIEQSADVVMMLYRDDYYHDDSPDKGCAELLIRKNRGGKTGMVPLVFMGEKSRFAPLDGDLPSKGMPRAPLSQGIDL